MEALRSGPDGAGAEPAAEHGGDDAGDDDGDPDGDDGDDGEEGAGAATDGTPGEPAAAKDKDPAAPADGQPGEKPRKTISYGRHKKDLAKAQKERDDLQAQLAAAQAERNKEREERVRLNERTTMLLEAIKQRPPAAAEQPAAPAADPEPDAEQDPIGNLQWHNKRLAREVEELRTGRQQEQQQTEAQREEQQIRNTFVADINREAASDPSFADAFVHLRETRYRELGYIYADIDIMDPAAVKAALTPDEQVRLANFIEKTFDNEQMMVARQALQARKSPAAVVRNLARSRGWAPKAAAPDPAPAPAPAPAARNGGGAPPARVPAAPMAPASVTDQLAAIRDGVDSSRSLSDAGSAGAGGITPDRIANMTDDEFEQLYETMTGQKLLQQAMGKPQ